MPIRTSARGRAHPFSARLSARRLLLPVLASAMLAGCGSSSNEQELEARIAAAEAKADAADKRSQQALSLAASNSSTGQFAPEPEVVVGDSGNDEGMTSDNSDDGGTFDNVVETPPGPPLPPG